MTLGDLKYPSHQGSCGALWISGVFGAFAEQKLQIVSEESVQTRLPVADFDRG
jgi:hypothetical protein